MVGMGPRTGPERHTLSAAYQPAKASGSGRDEENTPQGLATKALFAAHKFVLDTYTTLLRANFVADRASTVRLEGGPRHNATKTSACSSRRSALAYRNSACLGKD